MARSPTRILWMVLIATILASAAASAHQLQAAISTVTFITRSNSIEVIHRFYSHDAEHVLSTITGQGVDILRDEASQQAFGRYVSEHFQLRDQDEAELPLALLGVELDGDFIWVYQESPIPVQLTGLTVSNSALLDEIPQQANTVNIECAGELDTLIFSETSRTARAGIDFKGCIPPP